jgi:integrase
MRTGQNIFKRRDGRWEARYHKGRDSAGKLIYGFCYGKSYSEVKARVEEAKRQASIFIEASPELLRKQFHHYCEEWLKVNQLRVRTSTYTKYQTALEKHIIPALGNFFPNELTSIMISNFSQSMLYEKGLSSKTVKDILLVLHSVVKYTSKHYVGSMAEIEIIYPRVEERTVRVLSASEQKKLTEYLLIDADRCKLGVLLSLWTGLRIGELCALRGKGISCCDGLIRIEATMQRVRKSNSEAVQAPKTSIIIGPPKSKSSIRSIPLTKTTLDLCQRLLPLQDHEFVLSGTSHYMEPRALQYKFKEYMDDLNFGEVHFHTLRHTFATRCIEAGVDVKTLSEILGHSNPTITIKKYVHSSMDMKRRGLDRLDNFNRL